MIYTSPDNLPAPQGADTVAPLEEWFSDLAIATQAGLARPGTVASANARDAAFPNPLPGTTVWRTDLMWREMYLVSPQVRVAGWYPIDGALPALSATTGVSQSVSANSYTPLRFASLDINRGVSYGQGSNYLCTITQPGLYQVSGSVRFGTSTGDNRMYIQGSVYGGTIVAQQAPNISINTVNVSGTFPLAAGDQISVGVYAPAQSLNTGQRSMSVMYIGPA